MRRKRLICFILSTILLVGGCASKQSEKDKNTKGKLTEVSVWHYYSGDQQEIFNNLVEEYNPTEGKKQGVRIVASNQGSVNDLEKSLLDSVEGKAGAKEIPSVVAVYTDTAYKVDQKDMLADLSQYLTKKEIDEYMDSYIAEGSFDGDPSLKIFPVAKATEIFMMNKTDWDKFSVATGIESDACSTIEGITQTAQKYYEWTDSLTEAPNDGKAFFGRDAMANYFFIGAKQLGTELVSIVDQKPVLDFNKEVVRKLWDNYYVPYVKGYFAASGKFRSDDVKTGNIIGMVASSSGATFFPHEVVLGDQNTYPIETQVYECPKFEGGENYAVQQGAGMAVIKKDEEEVKAAVAFLKWFTKEERNILFSLSSGYLPVKKKANDKQMIDTYEQKSETVHDIISVSLDTVVNNKLYTSQAFQGGTDVRNIFEHSMSDKAEQDRATIRENMAGGETENMAQSPFLTDENFEQWYRETEAKLKEIIK